MTYSDYTITVDENEINSVTLNISSFHVDPVSPTFSTICSNDNQSGVSISGNVTVDFSESKENLRSPLIQITQPVHELFMYLLTTLVVVFRCHHLH